MITFLDDDQLESLLDYPSLIARIAEAFAGSTEAPSRSHLQSGQTEFLLMPAWDGRYVGTKLVTIAGQNRSRGLPTIHGLYLLFDGMTGVPLAALDGRVLTLRRTAATSALAASHLAREDAANHLMIGAGALAPYLIRAMACVREIKQVSIWNRTSETASRLAGELQAEGLPAVAVWDLPSAAKDADIISSATQSREPLIKRSDISAGVHLDLVGAYTAEMVEADARSVADATVFVDTLDGARAEAGDLIQARAKGLFTWDQVRGDLTGLITGRVSGRLDPAEITLFKSVGAAAEDLAGAVLAWETHRTQ